MYCWNPADYQLLGVEVPSYKAERSYLGKKPLTHIVAELIIAEIL